MATPRQLAGWPVRRVLDALGYDLLRRGAEHPFPVDFDEATIELCRRVEPYTLTSRERISALQDAVRYVIAAGLPGSIVECGVWRGGSMMVIAHTLVELGATDRDLYLFDTFTTMPEPGDLDVDLLGNRAIDYHEASLAAPAFAYLTLDQVHELLLSTGYPDERLHFVQGMVEDTIPGQAPDDIALCRLDTDWYVSTKHEMEHLFPRIVEGGVLLVDDYGHFMGCKQAVDEYFAERDIALLLNRIDFSGRLAIVTGDAHQRANRPS